MYQKGLFIAALVLCVVALGLIRRRRFGIPRLTPNPQFRLLHDSYRVWLLFLLTGTLVSLVVAILTGSARGTTLGYLGRAALIRAGTDSWGAMSMGLEHLRDHPNLPVYRDIFFERQIKFQYPPSSLLFLDIPQRLAHLDWNSLFRAANFSSWLCLPVIGYVCYKLMSQAALPSISSERFPRSTRAILGLTSLALVGSFYPLLRSFFLGQIQTAITLLVALALLAFQRQRYGLAGVLVGLCCGIKPQWIVILLWAVLRRQWRLAFAALGTWLGLLAASTLLYGLGNLLDYGSVIAFIGKHGESFYPNQSVNGLINRWLMNGNNLNWLAQDFPPFHPVVYGATVGSSLLILGFALVWRMNQVPTSLDFSIGLLSLTMASPIAWEHHYGILLPIFAVVLPAALAQQTFGRWTTGYLLLTFVLTSQRLDDLTSLTANSGWNFLQSYLLAGAGMMMVLLISVSALQQRAARPLEPSFELPTPTLSGLGR
jgi:alpha-1,2-mannosyltransferase